MMFTCGSNYYNIIVLLLKNLKHTDTQKKFINVIEKCKENNIFWFPNVISKICFMKHMIQSNKKCIYIYINIHIYNMCNI